MREGLQRHGRYKAVHDHKVAGASAHYKQMKDFMGTKPAVLRIKYRKLQGIDHTACGIYDASCQQPEKSGMGQTVDDLGKGQHTGPAHGNIEKRGKPFGAVDPAAFQDDTQNGDPPDQCAEQVSCPSLKNDGADGGIGARNQHKNHAVIQLFQYPVCLFGKIERVIGGAGCIKQDHTYNKNTQGDHMYPVRIGCGPDHERNHGEEGHHHADKMSNGAAGIFDLF